jgi:hypothetical protein
MASCFGGNFGCRDELTGSLTGFGTASLDVKANQDVADWKRSPFPRFRFAYSIFGGEITTLTGCCSQRLVSTVSTMLLLFLPILFPSQAGAQAE